MVAPTYVSTTPGTTLTNFLTIDPTGEQQGRFMTFHSIAITTRTWTYLNGFALLPGLSTGTVRSRGGYKMGGVSEAGPYSIQASSSTTIRGMISLWDGVNPDPANHFDGTQRILEPSGTTLTLTELTLTKSDSLLVSSALRSGSATTFTGTPASMSSVYTNTSDTTAKQIVTATPGSGLTGDKTWTWVGTSFVSGLLYALQAAPGSQVEYVGSFPI